MSLVFGFIVTTSFLPVASLSKVNLYQEFPSSPSPHVVLSNSKEAGASATPIPAQAILVPSTPTVQEATIPNLPMQRPIKLLFGGDVNEGRWGDNPAWHIPLKDSFAHLLPLFSSVDLVFFNAEGGLCDPIEGEVEVLPRGRDVLWVKPSSLIEIGSEIEDTVLVVGQANNHSMNLGDACRRHGQQLLEDAAVGVVGVGGNLSAARRPYVLEIDQTVIGLLAYAETDVIIDDWIANRDQPGVVPMDTHQLVEDLERVKPEVDFLIVTMHVGTQFEEPVSMEQTIFALTAIRNGADLVIGHGPHVPQGRMDVDGKPIYFSLGNGMMDQCYTHKQYRFWHDVRKNLWLEVQIQGSELIDVRHHVFYSEKCLVPSVASQEIVNEVEQTLANVSFEGDWPELFQEKLDEQPIEPHTRFPEE